MLKSLLDMNHQILHRRFKDGIRTVFLKIRERPHAVEVDYTFSRIKGSQPLGEKLILGRTKASTDGPKHDLMTICTNYPIKGSSFGRPEAVTLR